MGMLNEYESGERTKRNGGGRDEENKLGDRKAIQ